MSFLDHGLAWREADFGILSALAALGKRWPVGRDRDLGVDEPMVRVSSDREKISKRMSVQDTGPVNTDIVRKTGSRSAEIFQWLLERR
jgi:hypothetical protein